MKKSNLTVIAAIASACLCFALPSSAQDINFVMPYSSHMNLNPAFAGSTGCSNVVASYRNQWPNIFGNYVTSYLSYDQYIKVLRGGIGLNYVNDMAGQGALKSTSISGVYSAHIPVFRNKFVLSPSVQGGYINRKFDRSSLSFRSLLNPQYGFIYDTLNDIVSCPDFSVGMLGFNKKFNMGFVAFHLNEPKEGFISTCSKLPVKYITHFGINVGNVDSVRSFSFSPSIIYYSQQDFRSLLVSCAFKYDKYLLGIGYRNGGAIIGSVGFRTNILRISYSYDIIVSKLGIVTAGSHELAFSFLFNRKHKPKDFINFSTAAF